MSRKHICGRDLSAGPGTCYFWWDTCPKSVRHCWQRFVRANPRLKDASPEEQELAKAQWLADREHLRDPEPELKL